MDRADIPDTAVVADMPSGLRVVEAVPVQPLTAGRELHRVVSPVLGEDVLERQLTVAAVRTESDGVVSLRLVSPDGDSLPEWEPGAHVDLVLTDDLLRQYSLCGDPADAYSWQVAVLDEPNGRGGSRFVHDNVQPGHTLRVRGPRNHFPLVELPEYLFIAGGIGITPILAMIRQVAARGARWSLVYGGRTSGSMAFLDEIGFLRDLGGDVILWPQDERGLIDLQAVLGTVRPDCAIYCCGPEPLIAAVEAASSHWPAGSLHVERFRPKEGALDGQSTAFDVELAYSEITVHVRADQSIVESLEEVGIEVITSCREGTCGTCETPVLGGIPDHRDSLLTPEERDAGETMMICCGRSRTPILVLGL